MKNLVYNLPEYAKDYDYIVVNNDEDKGELWFYGAWNELSKAFVAATEVGYRFILKNDEVDFSKVMAFPKG